MAHKKFSSVTEALDDYHDRRRREIEAIYGTGTTHTTVIKPMSPEESAKRDRYRDLMRSSASNFSRELGRFTADNPSVKNPLPWELRQKVNDFLEFLGNEY